MFLTRSRAAPYDSRALDKKRNDDYAPVGGSSGSKPRDSYADKRDTFKRPITEYQKRDDPPPRSNAYDSRSVVPTNKDRYGSHGLPQSDGRSGGGSSSTFVASSGGGGRGGAGGRDDRVDVR